MKQELKLFFDFEFSSLSPDAQPISLGIVSERMLTGDHIVNAFRDQPMGDLSKSFYAEFSDFDLNRCDDWVKENVVSKLHNFNKQEGGGIGGDKYECNYKTERIKKELKEWLSQFR